MRLEWPGHAQSAVWEVTTIEPPDRTKFHPQGRTEKIRTSGLRSPNTRASRAVALGSDFNTYFNI